MQGGLQGAAGQLAAGADRGELGDGQDITRATLAVLGRRRDAGEKYVPGFGHRWHPLDPRTPRLLSLVDAAAGEGAVGGRFTAIGRAV